MIIARKVRILLLLLVLGCTVGCDQTVKHVARTNLNRFESISVLNGFGELRLAENPGSFLSLGAAMSPSVRAVVFTLGVGAGLVLLFGYLASHRRLDRMAFAGLALVAAGGMSNLIDRITRHGLVTDFLVLRVGPLHTGIFNVADVIVMSGAGLLAFALWRQNRSTAGKVLQAAKAE